MNGKDIFLGLKYIGEDLIHEAEYETLTPKTQAEAEVRRRTFRRPLLIAAAIALMIALVGCAVAYVLSMENVKIGDLTETRNVYAGNGYEVVGTETVNVSVLSLAGIKGSPAYQACTDFYAYCESQPQINTQADVDAQAALSYEATQNGWTLKVKDVDTDGYAIHLLFSLTAQDGIDISGSSDELQLQNGNLDILTCTDGRRKSSGSGRGFILVDDGDGLDNTTDLALEFEQTMDDGSAPFGIGTTWDVDIVDLVASSWDPKTVSYRVETLVEGEWTFTITFDESNGDYQEIQLLSEPTPAKGCIGWKADGTDVLKDYTLTSFILRKYTSTICCAECDERNTPDFYFFIHQKMYAVMKDGTEIEMLGSHDEIDLSQVDHVIFPDGTILKVPET